MNMSNQQTIQPPAASQTASGTITEYRYPQPGGWYVRFFSSYKPAAPAQGFDSESTLLSQPDADGAAPDRRHSLH